MATPAPSARREPLLIKSPSSARAARTTATPAAIRTLAPAARLTLGGAPVATPTDATPAQPGSTSRTNSAKPAPPIVSAVQTHNNALSARLPSKSDTKVIASTVPGPPSSTRPPNRARTAPGTASHAKTKTHVTVARTASPRNSTCSTPMYAKSAPEDNTPLNSWLRKSRSARGARKTALSATTVRLARFVQVASS